MRKAATLLALAACAGSQTMTPTMAPTTASPDVLYHVTGTSAYCGNRICGAGACPQSSVQSNVQQCALFVSMTAGCGTEFSYGADPGAARCDCVGPGETCDQTGANQFATYNTYRLGA
eukprot:gene57750-biopygen2408